LILVLPGVDGEVAKRWAENRRNSWRPTTEDELNDALLWMLMEFKVRHVQGLIVNKHSAGINLPTFPSPLTKYNFYNNTG